MRTYELFATADTTTVKVTVITHNDTRADLILAQLADTLNALGFPPGPDDDSADLAAAPPGIIAGHITTTGGVSSPVQVTIPPTDRTPGGPR